MNRRLGPILVALAVAGVMVAAYALSWAHHGPVPAAASRPTASPAASAASGRSPVALAAQVEATIVPAAIADESCDFDAVPSLDNADSRVRNSVKVNGFAQKVDARMDRETAVDHARLASSDLDAAAHATAAAALVRATYFGDPDQLINPQRCTWVVTVEAPFKPRGGPSNNVAPRIFSSYTITLDAASGEFEDLIAGPGAPDIVTGAGVKAPSN